MRLCFASLLLCLLAAGGCQSYVVNTFDGENLADDKVATLYNAGAGVMVLSVDGKTYYDQQGGTEYASRFTYKLKPGWHRIEVAKAGDGLFPNRPVDDIGYRATFDATFTAGKAYQFLVETMVVDGKEEVWAVYLVDPDRTQPIYPTVPPSKGKRAAEIREYLDRDLRPVRNRRAAAPGEVKL